MKRVCSFGLTAIVALAWLACFNVSPAHARKNYLDEFAKKYGGQDTPAQKAIDAHVKDYKCGICHKGPGGKTKKERNAYGAALAKVVAKQEKDAGKVAEALDKAAGESNPDKPGTPTFGDLLKKGELPAESEKAPPAAE